jgi:hypothetical protein
VRGLGHLARRFLGSLSRRLLDPADDVWIRAHLLPREQRLWGQLSVPDRKHAAGVAREVDRLLGGAGRPVIAAAALHDVGKIDAGLGTFARVGATVVGLVVDRRRAPGRIGRYLRHDAIGAELLDAAGSDPLTVTWAREHHLAPARWSLPGEIAGALAAADDD